VSRQHIIRLKLTSGQYWAYTTNASETTTTCEKNYRLAWLQSQTPWILPFV